MNCPQFQELVDRLVVGDLPQRDQNELRDHAARCEHCAELWQSERQLKAALAAARIPEPSPDFESRIRAIALSGQSGKPSGRWAAPVWGSAIAATFALGLFFGMQLTSSQPDQPVPSLAAESVEDQIDETKFLGSYERSVRLAFNSKAAMDNVTLILEMPAHAELKPFPGRQVVSWKIDLKQGDNVLELPVNVLFPGSGKLVAHLDNGRQKKTFTADLSNTMEPTL